VTGGRVVLTSFDGKPATTDHQCARDVLDPLRVSTTRTFSGIVAVILE